MTDEELITLFGRLSLKNNHLAERQQASEIAAGMNISTPRMRQVYGKIPPFVNDRLSLSELCEAAKSYCMKVGISGRLTAANWTAIANALCISPEKFEELGNFITSQS